ncbi:hypothetical protein [Flavobacterium sp. ASW18X]|uniref:hypothetical protein n=1 Tax=Flavobacterium sp. ASW18X TaxID=2572595 RepID=UPI0010AED9A5|nr:hypothetical protein [Flavobacterium sp. ASW18X]TKD60922.1 hypothetical protein FBT53_11710 [Flavobacterium sp. ASW18X]
MFKCPQWLFATLLVFTFFSFVKAQESRQEWINNYEFSLADFKAATTKVDQEVSNLYLQTGITIELGFQMTNIEFMFTKNFNDKVICILDKNTAVLKAQNQKQLTRLLHLASYDFDLSELYARKIRKELFENKKAFSNANFFQPYYSKMIAERNTISAQLYDASNFGAKEELLQKAHQKVREELKEYSDYCKECKPKKRKKK